MCAMRHYRSVQPVSLAQQYRLDIKPKRPQPKKVFRPKKGGEPETGKEEEKTETAVITDQNVWYSHVDEYEEFDFDDDEEYLDVLPSNVDLSQRYYCQACEEMKVMPIKCIYGGLVKINLVCKTVTLQLNDAKACTIALVSNSRCETIHFSNNDMGPRAGSYFADMLSRNLYITDVAIVWNRLESLGAETICKALLKNNTVKKLDLTGNGFKETDAVFFKELMEENAGIAELYLGHNYFREDGGEILAAGIAQNDIITVLDLSWNHLRLKGAVAIGAALEKNMGLETLDISWNGFHMEGLAHVGQALTRNNTLLDIDITCNRIMDVCLPKFLSGLKKNTTLKKLKMSRNHITHGGAMAVLRCLKEFPSMAIEYIDLGDQHVKEDFVQLLDELRETKQIDVKHGKVWSNDREPIGKQDQSEDELALMNENPHFVLMEFMRLQKLRLVDLFHQMDKDKSNGISVDEFKVGLEAVDIPLKRNTLERFVRACDSNSNGEIDFGELMDANKQYKEHLRRQIKADEPIETSAVGRIQKLLRKIMINNGTLKYNKPPPPVSE